MGERDGDGYRLFRQAQALLADRRWDTAASMAARAIAAGADSASVYELLGRASFAAGDHATAVHAFDAQAEMEPTNAYAHFGLARALEQLELLGQARRHLRLATAMSDRVSYRHHLQRVEARIERAA